MTDYYRARIVALHLAGVDSAAIAARLGIDYLTVCEVLENS